MHIDKLPLKNLLLIHNDTDTIYNFKKFKECGISDIFIQENQVMNIKKGTIRGMGYQCGKYAQGKLLRCIRGAIIDVVVDIRKESKTFKRWYSIKLEEGDKKQIFIPKGFAHGYLTIKDNTLIEYKVDSYYSAENDRAFRFDDSEIGIEWGIDSPILSKRDRNAPSFKDVVLKGV